MLTDVEQYNKSIELENYPVFPFIPKHGTYVTALAAGLYQRHKASYRGLACKKGRDGTYKVTLNGYIRVQKDTLVVPEGALKAMSSAKQELIDGYVDRGFSIKRSGPSPITVEFFKGSYEYDIALINREQFVQTQQLQHALK